MKSRLAFFAKMGLFWTGWFIFARIVFLIYNNDQTLTLSFREIVTVIFLGLRMDLAMAGYWLIITGILLSVPVVSSFTLYRIHNAFTLVLLCVSSVLVVVDLELYVHWGFRLNTTPLFYLSREAIESVNTVRFAILILLLILMMVTSVYIYYKLIAKSLLNSPPLRVAWSPLMILITGLLFIPIRSSFSVAPLNTGAVYFHKTKSFPNHAGINVVWNFFNSLSAKDNLRYPDNFYVGNPEPLLHVIEASDRNAPVLTTDHPDIILIILESFTANIVESLGGMKNVTPNLNNLIHEGILFNQFYASGDRTDKGLLAILSGYPAQPRTSIIRFPQKTQHLPFLSRSLIEHGYHTSFVYGGDIDFANMKSYLTSAGFSHITSVDDFQGKLSKSKWGVADQYVFQRMIEECDSARSPFFKVMLSLSSHEPFEVPMDPVFPGKDERSLFLNACAYTDKCLGEFIQQAKQRSWWKNTLVIITADHGHRFPNAEELKEKERFKIPMLWLGGAVAAHDTLIQTIGGQTDIVNSLLSQTGKPDPSFQFSKNLFSANAKPFAFYIFQNGFGYVDPATEYVYDFDFKKYTYKKGVDSTGNRGRAYMQALFNDYNKR